MFEVLMDIVKVVGGIVIGALIFAWRHRHEIALTIDDIEKALEDGKITSEELAYIISKIIERFNLKDKVVIE